MKLQRILFVDKLIECVDMTNLKQFEIEKKINKLLNEKDVSEGFTLKSGAL